SEMLPMVERIPPSTIAQLAPGPVEVSGPERVGGSFDGRVERSGLPKQDQSRHEQITSPAATVPALRPRLEPIAMQRFAMHFSIGLETRDKFRRVQALLSHQIPSGDIAQVFDRALDAALVQLERRKYGATSRPRPSGKPPASPRYVPAEVRRAVWARDGGRCT